MANYPQAIGIPYTLSASGSVAEVSAKADGVTYYNGKVYAKPNVSYINLTINDLVRMVMPVSYLHGAPSKTNGVGESVGKVVTITIGSASWELFFIPDYSANRLVNDARQMGSYYRGLLNAPIRLECYPAVPIWVTAYNGTASPYNINISHYTSASSATTSSLSIPALSARDATIYKASTLYNKVVASIGADKLTYMGTEWCGRYILIYRNAFGGRDFLALKGAVTMQDDYERQSVVRAYDGDEEEDDEVQRLYADISAQRTTTFIANSGLLTEDESSRMWHIFQSLDVWLYDTQEGTMTAVTIKDTSISRKTQATEGGKAINYQMTLEVAERVDIR